MHVIILFTCETNSWMCVCVCFLISQLTGGTHHMLKNFPFIPQIY